jgi:hypothetical protein
MLIKLSIETNVNKVNHRKVHYEIKSKIISNVNKVNHTKGTVQNQNYSKC